MNERKLVKDHNDENNEKLIELLKAVPVRDLISNALKARENSYSPYSGFAVGAALLLKSGKVILGNNIENAAYSATICAERCAFFKALSEGYTDFKAIAIVGGKQGNLIDSYAFPCGECRQVMSEFCSGDNFVVIVAKSETDYKVYLLKELLPEGFNLNEKEGK